MTKTQFNRALLELGFTQTSFAELTGKSDRMVRNWAAGSWPIPKEIALIVSLLLELKEKS